MVSERKKENMNLLHIAMLGSLVQNIAEYRLFFRALLQKRPIILKKENMNLLHIAMRLPESQMKKEILLVGSFKLQVSFAKEPYERDHILQKRPKISGRHPFSFPSQENTDRVCFIA